ncbi:MAG: rhodanese-like domain-containing protein [Bacilli bacterium]|nr:rhodanese-like domain-containing protein [Bacilli bacterium]
MKKFLILSLITLLLTGCTFSLKKVIDKDDNQKEYLNATELKEIMANNDYIIIDVRTPLEYEEEHIIDAINIPYGEVTNDTSLYKDKVILLYCKSGFRADIAYQTLYNLGFEVYNMGGIEDINLPKEVKSTKK